jgi:hypothetical protein
LTGKTFTDDGLRSISFNTRIDREFDQQSAAFEKTSPLEGEPPFTYQKLTKKPQLLSKITDFNSMKDSPEETGNSEPKSRGKEARRRRRERRNKDFKGLKLYPVMLRVGDKKEQFWRMTKPRVGGGRSVKTYANRHEAETAFDIAYVQAKNYGVGSLCLERCATYPSAASVPAPGAFQLPLHADYSSAVLCRSYAPN